jgi:hypothetical protein
MGMSYTIDPERRLVHVRGRGVLSTDDHHELTSRLLADPRFDPTYQSLGDFSEVTDVLVDTMALAHTAAVPMFDAGTRHAIVATSDVVLGMARMFATFATRGGQEVQVFPELHLAAAWLES